MAEDEDLPAVERDFDAIESAVMETSRGRWFLAEFKRRNRDADTQILLAAIARIGTATGAGPAGADQDMSDDLGAMAEAMDRARAEIAGGDAAADPAPVATAFARIVRSTRSATAGILDAAERIQEAAWSLREAGIDPAVCDELDGRSSQILTACALQGVTADRTATILDALRTIEQRLGAMRRRMIGDQSRDASIAESGAAAPPAPAQRQVAGALAQVGEIEFVTVAASRGAAAAPTRRASGFAGEAAPDQADPTPAPQRPPTAIPASLAAIEAIPFRDRMKLFT